ncbi:MAG: hypothetical protein IJ193_08540, partial [Bacilli bacterium]|nr:hypothetical protein [Bacilli bacterium]
MDNQNRIDSVSLSEWYQEGHTDEEVREVFLYLDSAMKYIHDRGYCVKSFHPDKINILNGSTHQIMFDTILQMPNRTRDDQITQDKYKREDVFNSSVLQIGLYSSCLPYLNENVVKEHFDELASSLPETDAPYYRGVIERGAFVYFTDYEKERLKRERDKMEQEMEKEFGSKESLPISNSNPKELDSMFSNEKINSKIYRQINREAAFLRFAIYPLLVTIAILAYVLY